MEGGSMSRPQSFIPDSFIPDPEPIANSTPPVVPDFVMSGATIPGAENKYKLPQSAGGYIQNPLKPGPLAPSGPITTKDRFIT